MCRSKRLGLVFTLTALGLAIDAHPAQGQTMSFFRQFRDPRISLTFASDGSQVSGPVAAAADTSGIYVISNRSSCHAGVVRCADVSKYDDRGDELWTREFTIPAFARLSLRRAVADASGLYILALNEGAPSSVVRKYSADGNELWTRQLGF